MKKLKVFYLILVSLFVFSFLNAEGTKWSINASVQHELSELVKQNSLPSSTSWVVDEEFLKNQEQLKIEAQEQEKQKQLEQEQSQNMPQEEDTEQTVKEPTNNQDTENNQDIKTTKESYVHIMQKDETLYSVAKRYNANLNTILQENNIKDATTVKEGDRIKISGVVVESTDPDLSEFIYYKIAKGDSLYKIATLFSTSVDEILKMNNIKQENAKKEILPGRILKVKDKERLDHMQGLDADSKENSKDRFEWPLVGRILKDYGASLNGTINEGINIKAKKNTIVKSTEGGTVIYTGNTLEVFGNLVLIQHDDNWISAYAHLESIMVKKGQKIKKGDSIARVGKTGYVNVDQLHFELRKNSNPVDPLKYLKSYR